MADQNSTQSTLIPFEPAANGYSPTQSAAAAGDLRRKKRNKLIMYIVAFAIFQVGIIALFSLTVMKVRAPKFRIASAVINDVSVGANSSFAATVNAEITVQNANFGRYKFEETAVVFLHGGAPAGRATVGASRANLRSTRKIAVALDLNIGASSELASDLGAGIITLGSSAKMRGKVELMFVMEKKRSAAMSCSMEIVVSTNQIRNIVCK